MNKNKSKSSRQYILLAGLFVALAGLFIAMLFMFWDLGHTIELLGYKKISSAEDLKAISQDPSGKYCLSKDIDLQGVEWTPISFNGILDGNGHEIRNLTLTAPGNNVRDTYDGNMKSYSTSLAGLFDVIEDAEIRNLTFASVHADINTDTPFFVGTIAGYMGNSKIINCKVNGDLYLRAHDRMFGVGGVVGYGYGTFENVEADVTLVCIDTDRLTKDEQFMGGIIGAGYPDFINCTVDIDGYGSEHGYAHNGGACGLYMFYPEGTEHQSVMTGNRVYGRITFFEENDDRRAYCKPLIGENLEEIAVFEDNGAEFRRIEVKNYDADLLPEERSTVFEVTADKAGRFELSAEYSNPGEDATYGLFINDRFYKKVFFPKGEGVVKDTVFLDEGSSEVKFKFLPGDGNITVKAVSTEKTDKKVTLIVAPHEDDEILAFAGTIQKTVAEGNIVKVLFLTNGDYFGTDYTSIRLAESVAALSVLGVDSSDVTVLGYGDMTLQSLLTSEDQDSVFRAKSGICSTYGDSTQNLFDYHSLNTGDNASYTGNNLRNDLKDYLMVCRPDRVYTTSEYEWHLDHKSAFLLVKASLDELTKDLDYHPVLCEGVIHGEDTAWPYVNEDTSSVPEFTDPFPSMDTDLDWNKVVKIKLSDEELALKSSAIEAFVSQNDGGEEYPGTREYNFSFCKRDEFYWEFAY